LKTIFGGDIRLARVEDVMKLVRQMTLAEIKAVVKEATQYHDSIVLALDPKWRKPDPHWEEDL
jgi:hypothetical protein